MNSIARLTAFAVLTAGAYQSVPQLADYISAPVRAVQGVATAVELQQIQKAVLIRRFGADRIPHPDEFEALVRSNFSSRLKDPMLDAWDNPYEYYAEQDWFQIRSLGPDGEFETDDDLYIHWEEDR